MHIILSLCYIGSYYTAVDLADIAHQLDEAEHSRMAEGDHQSVEYLTYLQVWSIIIFTHRCYIDSYI